jgi:hypothetical protein
LLCLFRDRNVQEKPEAKAERVKSQRADEVPTKPIASAASPAEWWDPVGFAQRAERARALSAERSEVKTWWDPVGFAQRAERARALSAERSEVKTWWDPVGFAQRAERARALSAERSEVK